MVQELRTGALLKDLVQIPGTYTVSLKPSGIPVPGNLIPLLSSTVTVHKCTGIHKGQFLVYTKIYRLD